MSYARFLLYEIGEEIGKSQQQMESLISILEKNWCDTKEALTSINQQQFQTMGIPSFIAIKIIEKMNKKIEKQKKEEIKEQKIQKQQKIEKKEKVEKSVYEQFKEQLITSTEKIGALDLLRKIIQNILTKNDPKFRKLNLNNQKLFLKLWKYEKSTFLLEDLGFVKIDNYYVIKDINREKLNTFLQKLKIDIQSTQQHHKKFNPYQASYSTNNPNFDVKQISDKSSNFDQKLDQLIKQRQEMINNYKINQKIQIYRKKFNYKQTQKTEIDQQQETSKNQIIQRILQLGKSLNQEETFSSMRKKKFDEYLKKPLIIETNIKIELPNNIIIQINFKVNDDLKALFGIIDYYLIYTDYYLFVPPFVDRKINKKDSRKTFEELNLIPNAKLVLKYFNDNINKEQILIKNQQKYVNQLI